MIQRFKLHHPGAEYKSQLENIIRIMGAKIRRNPNDQKYFAMLNKAIELLKILNIEIDKLDDTIYLKK